MRKDAHSQMPSATRPNPRAMDSSTSTRHATKAATTPRAPASPIRWTSSSSSLLARSISYLISWDTSLAANATRSPSDWPLPAGSGTSLRTIRPSPSYADHHPRSRTVLGHPRPDCSSGLAHVRQSPRLALLFPNGQHRGPVRRFRPRMAGTLVQEGGPRRAYRPAGRAGTPGPIDGRRILWHLHPCVGFRRIVTSQSHPDARAETCRPEEQTETGGCDAPEMRAAPLAGAPLRNHVRPGYQACTFFVSQAGRYRSCLA